MNIGTRQIGQGHPPYVIAEIGVNHDGEVARALMLTDKAADAGADAVKLQYFETDRLMSSAAKLAAYQKAAGETDPVAMLRRLELSLDEMALVVERAHKRGIHAIVTVFSVELVDRAEQLGWDAYKTASPDIVHRPLLERLMATGKPMIVSTGASTLDEVVRTVGARDGDGWLAEARDRLAVLQCVSAYPVPESEHTPGDCGLGAIGVLHDATGLLIGYSDHTESNKTGGLAVGLGGVMLEKHITDDRRRPGPDHKASLSLKRFESYVEKCGAAPVWREDVAWARERGVGWDDRSKGDCLRDLKALVEAEDVQLDGWDAVWALTRSRPGKTVLDCEQDVRRVSRQSIVSTRALSVGETITPKMLTFKRPGTGILPFELGKVVGRVVAREVDADVPMLWDDLEGGEQA